MWEYPEILYRKTGKGIMITACFGEDGSVRLPDEIDGTPVTMIAPYAFAGGEVSRLDEVWNSGGRQQAIGDQSIRLGSERLTEIYLPRYLCEIGRYAFYRCRNLRKLKLSNDILEIGGGALNGCRISEVELQLYNGEKCGLKSILDEIRYEIHARLHYHGADGIVRTADLLFPEHYEEAVENTPARILYTSHHGAGGYYRQCFYDRKLDYKKYDETFPRALTEETDNTVLRLTIRRLLYPYELGGQAKEQYENYLRAHLAEAASFFVETADDEAIRLMGLRDFWTGEALDAGIDCAVRLGRTEILSKLMDEKHQRFPKKRKTFDL